jgi:hypothetical protein
MMKMRHFHPNTMTENVAAPAAENRSIEPLLKQVKEFTLNVQYQLELERTTLLTRATIAEALLEN